MITDQLVLWDGQHLQSTSIDAAVSSFALSSDGSFLYIIFNKPFRVLVYDELLHTQTFNLTQSVCSEMAVVVNGKVYCNGAAEHDSVLYSVDFRNDNSTSVWKFSNQIFLIFSGTRNLLFTITVETGVVIFIQSEFQLEVFFYYVDSNVMQHVTNVSISQIWDVEIVWQPYKVLFIAGDFSAGRNFKLSVITCMKIKFALSIYCFS